MRRGLGLVLALGLLVGGAAACSDDDGGEDVGGSAQESTTTAGGSSETPAPAEGGAETTAPEEGGGETTAPEGGGVEAANDVIIQEYCDAAEAYDAILDESLANPDDGDIQDRLQEASGRLGEASDAVSPLTETLTPEQAQQFEECQS